MEKSIPKNVIFDFFEDKATSIQKKMIEAWLTDPRNEATFYQYLDEWEGMHPQYLPDTEEALEKYLTLMEKPRSQEPASTEENIFTPEVSRSWWAWWKIAVSVTLLMGINLYVFKKQWIYERYETGNAQTRTVSLTDGTVVTLNANSTLYVPRWGFNVNKREVMLEGEGEFNVTHTFDNKRFKVETDGDFGVEVFGTEFIVYSREKGKKVILNKGKVQVSYNSGRKLTMKPGDVVTFNHNSGNLLLTKTKQPELYGSWKNHQFYFDQTPLSEVAVILKDHFGLDVVFEDSTLVNRRLAGYFKAENSQEIIDVLTALLDLPVEQKGNAVIIHSDH